MATNTTNFNLKKPAYTDTADIADINGNMDKVDVSLNGLADAIAIVANNNTHAAITAGQYVYVHGHSSLAEGLYTAKSNIAANSTLSTSNLQADGSGGLNALNNNINLDLTISDLDNIPINSQGVVKLIQSISPAGMEKTYSYQCIGNKSTTRRSIILFDYVDNKAYINTKFTAWNGWQEIALSSKAGTITFATNFDYAGTDDYTSAVYKSGDIVVLNLCFWCNGSFSSNNWVNVCNISEGFRPKNARPIQVIVFDGGHTNGKVYDAKIATNGNINFYPSDITTISGRATINACWTV